MTQMIKAKHQKVIATFPAGKPLDKARIGQRVRVAPYGLGTIVEASSFRGSYFWVQLDDRTVGVCEGLIGLNGERIEVVA